MDVSILQWPAEAPNRDRLVRAGLPRLLMVDRGTSPPPPVDCLEDWIRTPASEDELSARVGALVQRSNVHLAAVPELDDDGLLRLGRDWVALTPVECRLARVLIDGMGTVVSRQALARAGWRAGVPARNVLDVHVLRLRRRVAPLGLAIRTFRGRGYLLEAEPAAGSATALRASS